MNNNTTKTKYFLYARKSSEQEDRQVLSIESQVEEWEKIIKAEKLDVVEVLKESHSAKYTGRPIFSDMMRRVERGEANGILIWNPSRLSRNSRDTGDVIYLMDLEKILEVRTPNQIFRNNPNDKFLLGILCGQAKLENDNKGEDVKRGLRKKLKMGWYPTGAFVGYLNTPELDKGIKIIKTDSERFHLVRKMFDMMLSGNYTAPTIHRIATRDWGFRMPGGKQMARSTIYRIFTQSFYYGMFEYPKGSGNWYRGKHEAMITEEEYDKIQILLGRKGRPRPKTHQFPFTGMIRCGECGAMVTAEEKIKRQKNGNVHRYIYYHCTKRKNPKCTQKTIEASNLEKQVEEILKSIQIPPQFHDWAMAVLRKEAGREIVDRTQILQNQRKEYDVILKKLDALLEMRMNEELSQEEYSEKKTNLLKEKERIQELLNDTDGRVNRWLQKAEEMFAFARDAKEKFENGGMEAKKYVLANLGSNLLLKDRKLSISIQKPLLLIQREAGEIWDLFDRLEPLKNTSYKAKSATFDDGFRPKLPG